MKLYAVTKGCYSDYHIIALTSNKSHAERIAKLYSNKWEDATVEEYEEGNVNDPRIPYEVYFYITGSVAAYTREYNDFHRAEQKMVYHNTACGRTYTHKVCVLAQSDEQAMKIAIDRLAQWKAEREGI
jgi:hypothetical protein